MTPDHAHPSLALRIAWAGLEHWQRGSGVRAQEFIDGALRAMNDPNLQRAFVRSSPCGVTDPQWAEVISRTCILAANEEQNRLTLGSVESLFEFKQLSSFACKHHAALDGFTALSTDPIWGILTPPFDWICSCQVLQVMEFDAGDLTIAKQSAAARFGKEQLKEIRTWMQRSPATAVKLL
jgi:hypothetical protein